MSSIHLSNHHGAPWCTMFSAPLQQNIFLRHCNSQLTNGKVDTHVATVDFTEEQNKIAHSPQEENWVTIGGTKPTLQDEHDLGSRSHQWLNDRHVTGAQYLLKQCHPDVSGLQPTTLQLTRTFDVHLNREFVQCLNVSSNHWITVSTVGCSPGVSNVYDSMHLGVSTSIKKVIADMMFTDKKSITIHQVHIQQQMGGSNCGLFAIANAAALCNGKDPGTIMYIQRLMREHLRRCLAVGILTEVPCREGQRRVPQIIRTERVRVYCIYM